MKILVVDDRPAVRDPIVEAFRGAGHAAAGAATGAAALAHLTNDKPDALLLGLQLPDISGLEVLRALRGISATALLPVILLTSRETRENILTAARLGVQGYVLKNKFAMKDLLACVEKYDPGSRSAGAGRRAAASAGEKPGGEMPQLMTREEFLNRARPVLEASSTQTIEDAIRQVGCGCLGDIAAAVAIFQAMPDSSADGVKPAGQWRHGFAVARLCQMLATAGGRDLGLAYLLGLCHDLGQIVLQTLFRAEYQQVIEVVKATGRASEEIELRMLGVTNAALTGTILHAFGLPEELRLAIEWFHANRSNVSLGRPGSWEGLLRIAQWYANGILLPASETAELNLLTAAQADSALGFKNPPRPDAQTLREEVMALTAALARLPADPPNSAEHRRVWIARDVPLSPLDSVTAALTELAHADVRDRLPTAAELKGLDALVVVGDKRLQDSATALMHVLRSSIPALRILPARSAEAPPDSLVCPIRLADVEAFFRGLAAGSPAQSNAA